MITDEMIRQAKGLELPDLIRKRNIDLIPTNGGSAFKCKCPFHEDNDPSLNLNHKDGIWLFNCFGCGAGGTVIDFIMKFENKDFKSAVLSVAGEESRKPGRLSVLLPSRKEEVTPQSGLFPEMEQRDATRNELLSMITEHYHKNLMNGENKGKAYLEKRGLWDEEIVKAFKLGYSTNDANEVFKDYRLQMKDELGIFKVNYWETFANSVIFPVLDLEGNPTDLYARRTMNYTDRANHCYNKGKHQGIFNIANVKDAEIVILTEGIIDALSIYKAGFKNVTALYGINGMTSGLEELLRKAKSLIFAFDNDEAGKAGIKRYSDQFKEADIFIVKLPDEVKDMNELLCKSGVEAVRQSIEKASGLSSADTGLGVEELQPDKARIKFEGSDLIYQSDFISYRLRNAGALKSLSSLRFVVTATKDAQSYTDRIDLYLSRSRKLFAMALFKMFDIQTAVIENDLAEITRFIEEDFKKKIEGKTQGKEAMTPEEQTEALRFLKSSNLITAILEDITSLGYVGEDENKLLLFLCAVSRKLNKPISVLIRSQSSTGKSFLMDIICALLPAEDVHKWTSLTPKALYYMAPDALKHKFIAIDERAGMEEAEYPIRSLQSGGMLSLAVPIKNPTNGQIMTEQIIKEGPISYVDGSTDTRVNPENANRCFEIFLDETAEQTKRVQSQQKKSHSLEAFNNEEHKEIIKRIHRNAQRLLKPVKVIIPYIDLIDFPSDWIRTRRDHDRFLSLIVCIAFLHQYQRERKEMNGKPYMEANLKDYLIAYKLAKTILFNTFADLEKPVADFYSSLFLMVEGKAGEQGISSLELEFTRRDVRAFTKRPDYLVHRHMSQLLSLEYVSIAKSGASGSRHFYKLVETGKKQKTFEGLTTPEELRHRLKARNEEKKDHA